MLWVFFAWTAIADDACSTATLRDVLKIPEPAVIVLGERHGAEPDMARALRVIRRLHVNSQNVTLATDMVHRDQQSAFDSYASGDESVEYLAEDLSWNDRTGFPFAPYGRLFRTTRYGVSLVAVGASPIGPPPERRPPIPQGYANWVASAIPNNTLAFGMDTRIARTLAWTDFQIAEHALLEWNNSGYLVILTERARVEGGMGVQWQAAQLTDIPVHSFILSWSQAYCTAGDKVWAKRPLLTQLGLER